MRIFISSLIGGYGAERAAARSAIEQLGHQAIMAEDFGAVAQSPQVACLEGVRRASLVVLILGADYGPKQPSGLSATHEEYREAKERCPVIGFVQQGVDRAPDQAEFIKEVEDWESGLFRGAFSTPDELKTALTLAIHRWELANAAGPIDATELLNRARSLLPSSERGRQYGRPVLQVAVAAGPTQPILRPAEIEAAALARGLTQAALFGPTPIFDPARGTVPAIKDGALRLAQSDDGARITLDGQLGLLIETPLENPGRGDLILIQEDVDAALRSALRFASGVLDELDQTQRLTHVVVVVDISESEMMTWRTRAEQAASPGSYTVQMDRGDSSPVNLTPPQRARPALSLSEDQIVEDLVTLLKRRKAQS